MSYVAPTALVDQMISAGSAKVKLSAPTTMVRAFMAGAILALAAAFATTISVQTGAPIVGAALFPVGFCMLYLLGYDLLTGVFVLTPVAWYAGAPGVTWPRILRNWGLVFVGNFAGAFVVALMMASIFTFGFAKPADKVGMVIAGIGESRTLGYAEFGGAGMLTLFLRAMLCNWMVSTGVVGAMLSTSVTGKVVAMWMPIMVFFGMAFEHSIVNMFLFPSALLMGGKFSWVDYILWNELPTVVGNLVGGLMFTGIALYAAHGPQTTTAKQRVPSGAVIDRS
jgi:formate transporter